MNVRIAWVPLVGTGKFEWEAVCECCGSHWHDNLEGETGLLNIISAVLGTRYRSLIGGQRAKVTFDITVSKKPEVL